MEDLFKFYDDHSKTFISMIVVLLQILVVSIAYFDGDVRLKKIPSETIKIESCEMTDAKLNNTIRCKTDNNEIILVKCRDDDLLKSLLDGSTKEAKLYKTNNGSETDLANPDYCDYDSLKYKIKIRPVIYILSIAVMVTLFCFSSIFNNRI